MKIKINPPLIFFIFWFAMGLINIVIGDITYASYILMWLMALISMLGEAEYCRREDNGITITLEFHKPQNRG